MDDYTLKTMKEMWIDRCHTKGAPVYGLQYQLGGMAGHLLDEIDRLRAANGLPLIEPYPPRSGKTWKETVLAEVEPESPTALHISALLTQVEHLRGALKTAEMRLAEHESVQDKSPAQG